MCDPLKFSSFPLSTRWVFSDSNYRALGSVEAYSKREKNSRPGLPRILIPAPSPPASVNRKSEIETIGVSAFDLNLPDVVLFGR